MTRRRRLVALVLGVPLALITVGVAALAWVLATESGTQWAVGQARARLPEGVRFERVNGVLAGPLELRGLVVQTPAASLRVESLRLDWAPWALLAGEVRIRQLALSAVDVGITPGNAATPDAGEAAPAPALPADLSLPLALVVERLTIEGVAVRLADGSVQRVERVALRASAGADGVAVEGLEVAAPLADIDGGLHMEATQPYALDGTITWRVRPPDPALATMAGRLELGGSLQRLQARLIFEQPATATLSLQARLFGDTPQWSGEARMPVTGLRTWWQRAPQMAAGATLQLEGSFTRAAVEGDLELEGLPTGPLRAQLAARGSIDAVTLERLHIEAERRPGAVLTARGEADLAAAAPHFEASVDWTGLAWPLDGPAAVSSDSGTLALNGSPDDYELTGDAAVRTPQTGGEPVRLAWNATGSTEALSALELDADWYQAHLSAAGKVRWAPDGEAQLRLDLAGLDPGRLAEPLRGRLAAGAELRATWGDTVTAALDLQSVDGELNGRPLSGAARLRYDAGAARIERLTLNAGDAQVEASGSVTGALALDWRVAIPRLGDLVPGWRGRVDGSGRVAGAPATPRITLDVTAAEVATPALDVATLTLDGTAAPLGGARSELAVNATEVVTGAVTLHTLALHAAGTPADHRLEATLKSDRGDAELALAGGLEGTDWQGRLSRATLTPAGLDPWRLAGPAGLAWRDGAADLGQTCWRNDGAHLCVTADGNAEHWQAQLDARSIPLGLVGSFLRGDLEYSGAFDLQADLAARGGPVTGHARLDLTPGRISGVLDEEPTTLLDYGAGRVELRLDPQRIDLDAHLPLAGEGAIRIDGRLGRDAPRALDGHVQARIEDLGLLSVLAPAVGRVEGRLLTDIELGGTLAQPSAAGSARLEAGRLELVPLGIELTDLRAGLATEDDAFEITLGARSGDGDAGAKVRLDRVAGGWRGSGSLSGEDFEAVDLPQATVVVSPDIEWRLAGRDVSVSGAVTVPSARIAPRDLSDTVQTSPDAVIVGAPGEAEEKPPLRVTADVAVTLGPGVHVDAFGLEGRLAGSIRVREQPGQLTSATGELRVEEGSYTIYAQTLQIERGRVIFDGGPVANPGLDVRAVRRPGNNVLVGVNVRGTLREPRVDLFSEPPMEQSQQLSYLIVGVPLGETSSGQQSSVAAAAAALAGSEQGTRLANRVGIQQVTVDEGEPGEGASLVLGRYLSPRLYVGYGIGFAEQANSVRMRYTLGDNWSLEARSGVTSSADLLYSIEVDSSVDAIPRLPGIGDDRPKSAGSAQ